MQIFDQQSAVFAVELKLFFYIDRTMKKRFILSAALTAILVLSCSSKKFLLKENWIDERDVMALRDMPMDQWLVKAGRPTLVEIIGDTNVYYYNYSPTMYVVGVYSEDYAKEIKPSLEHAIEVWGSRKDLMQIKVVNGLAVQAIVINGPDVKTFIRDLSGNLVLNPNSGYVSNISQEIKVDAKFMAKIAPTIMPAATESPDTLKAASESVAETVPVAEAAHAPATEAAHAPAAEAAHAPATGATHAPVAETAHAPAAEATHAPTPETAHVPAAGATHAPAAEAAHEAAPKHVTK